jgi:prepilin signal peptidase PulO-like enzyme (type II secretory pathway)
VKALILPLALALLGFGAGFGVRLLSVRLARIEELEPGRAGWQLAGPPVVTAALFFAFGYGTGWTAVDLVLRLLFAAVFVQVIFFDLEHRLILDWITYPALALALVVSVFHSPWWAGLASGIAFGGALLLLGLVGSSLLKEDALGLGDVKLATLIGLLLGPLGTVEAAALGFAAAGVVAISVAIWRRSLQGSLALGPFLAAGALVALYGLAP